MNILISTNSKFVPITLVMLNSLFQNNSGEKFSIYLFYNKLRAKELFAIGRVIEIRKHKFIPIKIKDDVIKDIPTTEHLSVETYFRLFASIMLPKEVEKILYLDADIIVKGNIKNLYNIDLKSNYFAAAKDTSKGIESLKKLLNIPEYYGYINAGILLMNIKEMRETFNLEEALEFAKNNRDKVPNCDQDVINGLYYKKIVKFSNVYNYEARFHSVTDLFDYIVHYKKLEKRIIIIHYMGKDKPWKKGYGGKFAYVYNEYAENIMLSSIGKFNFILWLFNVVKLLNVKL